MLQIYDIQIIDNILYSYRKKDAVLLVLIYKDFYHVKNKFKKVIPRIERES